ncbi:MAG: aldehyde dehydrogenase family protein [Chloroflexi bacterium]|nr:MAG: aldehyde dehydrogenase family protein [Chloroflexota bacterium]
MADSKQNMAGISVKNPVTGQEIGVVPKSTRDDVQAAVERAQDAQLAWGAASVEERCRVIRKWGDLIWENQERVMRVIRDETGKNDTGAFIEIIGLDNYIAYYTKHASEFLRPERRQPIFPIIQRGKVYHKPLGVVGVISPWNYPMMLAFLDAVPALLAGNTVVIKPSEITPFSALVTADLAYQAGVPEHVIQIVTGDGETGAALVDYVDMICFTGSTATGRKVAVQAAERLIPFSLELGGKDAMIVLADADLDIAASAAITGSCENAGQMCISIERIYVEEKIYDRFVEKVKTLIHQMTMGAGDGLDIHMGSMTNERELLRVEEHIKDAVEKGAEVIYGGKRRPDLGPLFFEPTILINVDHSMKIMKEETFGPVIPIMKVYNVDEAVRLANDTEYGLSGSVFTRNLALGERIATRLNTGDVSVNRTQAVPASAAMSWGGQKYSGFGGRRGDKEGILRFTATQSILVDTQIGYKPGLTILDPTTLMFLKLMRLARRYVPFL